MRNWWMDFTDAVEGFFADFWWIQIGAEAITP